MIKLLEGGMYLVNGTELMEPEKEAAQGFPAPKEAAKQTMAYRILEEHNTSGNMEKLQIKFGIMEYFPRLSLQDFPETLCSPGILQKRKTVN